MYDSTEKGDLSWKVVDKFVPLTELYSVGESVAGRKRLDHNIYEVFSENTFGILLCGN